MGNIARGMRSYIILHREREDEEEPAFPNFH
jgi:hypothetical protein